MSNISNMTACEIIAAMNESEKENLYRLLRSDHVYEDVMNRLADEHEDICEEIGDDEDEINAFVMEVVNKFVYDGEYNNDLSYWTNIDNLIRKVKNL